MFYASLFASENTFRAISSDASQITIEYLPEFTSFQKTENGYVYSVKNASLINENNLPFLYAASFSIGVPSFNNKIEILNADYETINGDLYFPEYFNSKGKTSDFDNWIKLYANGIMHGFQVENYVVFPLIYSSEKHLIKKLKRIVFRINYGSSQKQFVKSANNDFFPSFLLNSNSAKNWKIKREKKSDKFNSVLSSGKWFRTNITEEGIYKVDYSTLTSLGFDPETDDPRTIKIYNNGGAVQPEKITKPRINDLAENPILFFGDEDGKLDDGDYFVFYGHGSDFFRFNDNGNKVQNYHHPFSKKNYYWITWGGSAGKRVSQMQNDNSANPFVQKTTKAYIHHEKDNFNPMRSGRLYFGEEFNSSNRTLSFTNTLHNRVPNTAIKYAYGLAVLSSPGVSFTLSESGNDLVSKYLSGYGYDDYIVGKYHSGNASFSGNLNDDKSNLIFSFQANTTEQKGALDYYEIEYEKYLYPTDDFLIFYSKDTTAVIKYELKNFESNQVYVFAVNNFQNIEYVEPTRDGNAWYFTKSETYNYINKYVAFAKNAYKSVSFESVENQNIHGTIANTKYIVIAPKEFSEEASDFVDYKNSESPDAISTSLFYIDEIYNEFSGGIPNDPVAIRDFIMYAYNNWDVQPEYVLLFGKGTFDYFDTEGFHNNFIPTYQNPNNTLHEVQSYITEDFFVWVDGNDNLIDLSIGRLPVKSKGEAFSVVQKIKDYENNEDFSQWRRTVTFVSDDGWSPHWQEYSKHTAQSENLAKIVPEFYTKNKIYIVLYPTEITGTGRRKPLANKAIIEAINNGTVVMNYQGHGNPQVWAHEQIFVSEVTIPQLKNSNYFFSTVAACSFGLSDDPNEISGAELMLLKPDGGTIGSFASNRPVFGELNAELNELFYKGIFVKENNGKHFSIGQAYLFAKTNFPNSNSFKFSLLGDPTLRLKIPQLEGQIDSVNGFTLDNPIQIKALSDVKVDASLANENDFTGESLISVFDSKRYVTVTEPGWNNFKIEFEGALLYKGRASVELGKTTTRFVVPKDISFENKKGKVVAYFHNDEIDGAGVTTQIIVGGIEERANDGSGPEIELAFDKFGSNGQLVNPDFSLLARLTDETGINTSGAGLGHTLEAIIDGDAENAIDLTNSFVGDIDEGGRSGEIKYNFYGFEPGEHSIKIKAWDVFNNYSEKEAEFTVVNESGLVVRDVVNYPNPFPESTYFTFQHNLNEPVDVKINIYTVYGRKIKEIEEYGITDKFVKIFWDGRDEDGDRLANGTYLYKLIIKNQNGDFSKSYLGKLAVMR